MIWNLAWSLRSVAGDMSSFLRSSNAARNAAILSVWFSINFMPTAYVGVFFSAGARTRPAY